MSVDGDRTKDWIVKVIRNYVNEAAENSLGLSKDEKAFDLPLVGFSNGADPLYEEYRRHIGSFYFMPVDLFTQSFPSLSILPEDLTVISWIIPSTRKTREEQAGQKKHPSERWVRTRALGEKFNNAIRRKVVTELGSRGIDSLAPLLSPMWSRYNEGPYAPCSNWSERHAAYAGGLGTFGLCDGLITPVGKAVRIGSVIARVDCTPSHRDYDDHHAYCLHFTDNSCRECIPRCPVGAISETGHDKQVCMQYTEKAMNAYVKKKYNLDTYACGLCQAGVACTYGIPETK